MRILHVNKFLYRRGGAESYMFDLAALQRAEGAEIAFFGMEHPENDALPYARHFPPRVEFRDSSASARLSATARMFHSSRAAAGMKAVVEDFRPDVVHLHNIYHHLSPSILGPLEAHGVPAVMTLHDYKLACPTYQFLDHGKVCEACLGGHFWHAATHRCKDGSVASSLLASLEAYAHRWTGAYEPVRRFICPSRFLLNKMGEAGVFPDRMRHVNHFVDCAAIEPRSAAGAGFVFAGRLAEEKGIDTLVRAAGLAGGVQVTILGDGPERSRLEALAAEVAPGRVRFTGRVGKVEVLDAMRGARAVVVASRWYENQPMTVLEAMACGTPVIATTLGGIPELVQDGISGFAVPADDPEALARRMGELDADPGLSVELGAQARADAVTNFTPARHLERVGAVYEEAGARQQVPA